MFNQPAAWNKYIKTIIGTFEEQCVIPEAKAQAPAWKACLVPVCFFPLLILTIKCNLVTLESSYSNTAPNQEFGACAFAVSPRHQTWDFEWYLEEDIHFCYSQNCTPHMWNILCSWKFSVASSVLQVHMYTLTIEAIIGRKRGQFVHLMM